MGRPVHLGDGPAGHRPGRPQHLTHRVAGARADVDDPVAGDGGGVEGEHGRPGHVLDVHVVAHGRPVERGAVGPVHGDAGPDPGGHLEGEGDEVLLRVVPLAEAPGGPGDVEDPQAEAPSPDASASARTSSSAAPFEPPYGLSGRRGAVSGTGSVPASP